MSDDNNEPRVSSAKYLKDPRTVAIVKSLADAPPHEQTAVLSACLISVLLNYGFRRPGPSSCGATKSARGYSASMSTRGSRARSGTGSHPRRPAPNEKPKRNATKKV
jgi:hypothetical protein